MSLELQQALQAYGKALPLKTGVLELGGAVLLLLEEAGTGLPGEIPVPLEIARQRLQQGHIILKQWLTLDETSYYRLVNHLLTTCQRYGLLANNGEAFITLVQSVHPEHWLEPSEELLSLLEDFGLPAPLGLWIMQKALTPFYQQAAAPFRQICRDGLWDQGMCPFCGRLPSLSCLDAPTGRRWLYCNLCATQWPFARLTCPLCGTPQEDATYLYHQDDPARRLDLCRVCGGYFKTIDERRLNHPIYPPLEEFITLDLDDLASQYTAIHREAS